MAIKQGDELFAVAADAVLGLRIWSITERVEAHRFRPEQPLTYSFERDSGKQFERCAATPRLDATLTPWTSVRVRQVLDDAKSKKILNEHSPSKWIQIELRDVIEEDEPLTMSVLAVPGRPEFVYARVPLERALLVLDAKLLLLTKLGCGAR